MISICRIGGIAIAPLLLVMLCPFVAPAGGAVEFERIDPFVRAHAVVFFPMRVGVVCPIEGTSSDLIDKG